MTEPVFDLIIRGGRVTTATDVFEADVAVSGETIAAPTWILHGISVRPCCEGSIAKPGRIETAVVGLNGGCGAYWKAVSEKFLSLRECSRSSGMSANFSIALIPIVRCWATCRL